MTLETNVIDGPEGVAAALIQRGMIPSAPSHPSLAVMTCTLEFLHSAHMHCPHLAINPFSKSLANLHGNAFHPYFSKQFWIAYVLYLQLHTEVQLQVQRALGRDGLKWWLKNACSACIYCLEGEPALLYDMLVTMDGNNSLKHMFHKDIVEGNGAEDLPLYVSKELLDSHKISSDYYLNKDVVNCYLKESILDTGVATSLHLVKDDNPCALQWKNMVHENDTRMWGIFDKSGIFLSLCCHRYVLVFADMIQSREQAKYPLAVVDSLLDAFGTGIGGRYDISCRFATTLSRSIGLEDLEGCKHFFSKSNALTPST
ncbi:hypothetical protein P691DRAFT_799456 [Macrolepiota fuliginosa MF-IS2]|uniref:Uncharacterized protein n=1 Tax=Macrolepiota fuliginosa MF-IS2 TaxID=1400762 RepID=A0A9P6BXG8_9AGAR|nr:hypothetical protein P691DRAFT_799456 [Macrolepiota fuliginosa MF-IS2]